MIQPSGRGCHAFASSDAANAAADAIGTVLDSGATTLSPAFWKSRRHCLAPIE
jgi:hypothetical protein